MAFISALRSLPGFPRRTLWAFGAAALSAGVGSPSMAHVHAAPIAPHRDGNIAVAEELEAARRKATVAAYDLFLARHPDHELARAARRERALILRRRH